MKYDAIIIGAGHNGLTCAAFLAKAQKKVLVLEKRAVIGGAAATEEVFPQCLVNTGAFDAGILLPEIIEKLNLNQAGLTVFQCESAAFAPLKDGTAISLWRDMERTVSELRKYYPDDAKQLIKFNAFMNEMSQVLRQFLMQTPPDIRKLNPVDLAAYFQPTVKLRKLGKRKMMQFLRILPLSVSDFLDEWFTSKPLKGLLASAALKATGLGPHSSGTAFSLIYQYTGRENGAYQSSWFFRGGIGTFSEALANYIRSKNGEVRLNAGVDEIFINDKDKAVGVKLESGEKEFADKIISNCDARTTLFDLVGTPYLDPIVVRKVRSIRFRSGIARVNFLLNKLPDFPSTQGNSQRLSGHIVINPSIQDLEDAADSAKYGDIPEKLCLDMLIPTIMDASLTPKGKHLALVNVPFIPFKEKDENYKSFRELLVENVISLLTEYAPDFRNCIDDFQLLTPNDYQENYNLPNGDAWHGQMTLDQLLIMRPIAGFSRYKMPLKNLYLCGASTHPGGGLTGAPGYNAAREILKKW